MKTETDYLYHANNKLYLTLNEALQAEGFINAGINFVNAAKTIIRASKNKVGTLPVVGEVLIITKVVWCEGDAK